MKNTKLFFGLTIAAFLSVSSGYAMEDGDVRQEFTDVSQKELLENPEKCLSLLDKVINGLLKLEKKIANSDKVPLSYSDSCTICRLTKEEKSLDVAKKTLIELRENAEKHHALLFEKMGLCGNEFSEESIDFLSSYSVVKQWFEIVKNELIEISESAKEFRPDLPVWIEDLFGE